MNTFFKTEGVNLKSLSLSGKKIKEFDVCIIATDHSQINYASLLKNSKLIFDSRNVYNGKYVEKVERL